jgi:hypothetical protein
LGARPTFDLSKPLGKLVKWAGGVAGGVLGGSLGNEIGSRVGNFVSGISGMGDYNVHSNTLLGLANKGAVDGAMGPAKFLNSTNGVRIQHREYLRDVSSSSSFTLTNFFINPGLSESFPWLSRIAANFEQYKFHGLIYEFRSTSADALNSTNTALGTVIMGTDYNPASPNFISKPQMEQSEWTTSAKPSCSFMHPIECAPGQAQVKLWYCRSTGVPTGSDQRLFDLANFQFATAVSDSLRFVLCLY